ncbi:tetratricopeptide repeat protein [Erythrobacter jejuensis]|uniref:Tetratricopeptide repeat protein n=2 Tax=Parerythrobacter jejuensis TaxID=795812 RepID=A0A845ASS2_9SPHN|nr:tetratricopeptide repeat protein [Parerythrobacter jejuensis]
MVDGLETANPRWKELLMRFAPAAAALSLLFAVTASVSQAGDREPDPRAAILIAEGRAALTAGQPQKATDSFEAALAVDPAFTPIYLDLAEASRREGLQGKAISYYRETLKRDPDNFAAMSGEGAALVEKGAVEKARLNLTRLESLCGSNCPETRKLATAIARGPQPRVLTAEAVMPEAVVTQN